MSLTNLVNNYMAKGKTHKDMMDLAEKLHDPAYEGTLADKVEEATEAVKLWDEHQHTIMKDLMKPFDKVEYGKLGDLSAEIAADYKEKGGEFSDNDVNKHMASLIGTIYSGLGLGEDPDHALEEFERYITTSRDQNLANKYNSIKASVKHGKAGAAIAGLLEMMKNKKKVGAYNKFITTLVPGDDRDFRAEYAKAVSDDIKDTTGREIHHGMLAESYDNLITAVGSHAKGDKEHYFTLAEEYQVEEKAKKEVEKAKTRLEEQRDRPAA